MTRSVSIHLRNGALFVFLSALLGVLFALGSTAFFGIATSHATGEPTPEETVLVVDIPTDEAAEIEEPPAEPSEEPTVELTEDPAPPVVEPPASEFDATEAFAIAMVALAILIMTNVAILITVWGLRG